MQNIIKGWYNLYFFAKSFWNICEGVHVSKICRPTAYNFTKNELLQSFFQRFLLLFKFPLGTPTLRNSFEWLLPNFCFTRLFNTNKKKSINSKKQLVSSKFLSYFKFLILRISIILFFEILSPEWRKIHKLITLSFLKTGLLILATKMWHIWPCILVGHANVYFGIIIFSCLSSTDFF